jgi:hypothetical protein
MMTKLKDVYPLYLANEAQQPNTDLEVTDKFTGEVAFRCAAPDAATIDCGHRRPRSRRPSRWRACRPMSAKAVAAALRVALHRAL